MKELSKKDRAFHEKALERFKQVQEHESDLREVAEDDFCFVSGDQWPEDARRDRELEDRPVLTINRLPTFIAQVVGDARQNKPAVKVMPVDDKSDPDTAEIYSGLIRQVESASKAHEAYLTGLEHSASGGWGHWRVVTQFADDTTFDQDIRIKRIVNPFSVYWDPSAREYDRSDARWCFVTEWMSKETFEEKYPDHAPDDWEVESRRCHDWVDNKDDQVRVAEYWLKEFDTRRLALLESGETVDVTDRKVEGIVRVREVRRDKVTRYVLSGVGILEGPKEWPGKHIPIVPVWGPEEYVDGDVRPRSVIRYAKDAQRQYNYWQSQITEKIMMAPRSPWLVTTTQIKGLERFWNAANEENRAYLPYNPDPAAGGPPQRNAPPAINQAELAQSAQAIDDMKSTTGIFDASLGNRSNETSGIAINARKVQSQAATFAWIDNLARSITRTGQILVDLIPRIYDTERMVRILGVDEESDFVPVNTYVRNDDGTIGLMHDLSTGKYDVRVTMGPSFATQRAEAAESLIQFIQAVPQAGQVAADLIAKNMDWPGAEELSERLKKLLPEGMDEDAEPRPPDPVQEEIAQLQLRRARAEAAKAEADAGFTAARTQSEAAKTEKTEAETDTELAKTDAQIDKIAAETAKIVTETLIAQGVIPAQVNASTQ